MFSKKSSLGDFFDFPCQIATISLFLIHIFMKKIFFSVLFVFLVSSCSETKESLENTLDTTAKNVSVKVETMSDAFQDAKDRTASGIKQAQDTVNAV